jgi:hypothetical protein
MLDERFALWRREGLARGQRKLAQAIRLLVYKAEPALFDLLDYEDDDCFLDPLLFAYFTNPAPKITLPQLLVGRIAPARRPAIIEAHSDAVGKVCLPGIGWLQSGLPNAAVPLAWNQASGEFWCKPAGKARRCDVRAPRFVPQTGCEIEDRRQPLFDRFYAEGGCSPDAVQINGVSHHHVVHLIKACALLRQHCPELADGLLSVTRRIVLYRSEQPYSFATLSAHGAIFVNVTSTIDEVFFVEDLAHQAAHVMFNALTLEKKRYLLIDPDTPLVSSHGNAREARTLYAAYHGLFTYVIIGRALAALLERSVWAGRQEHELIGRLGIILRKFAIDLALLDRPGLFTSVGRRSLQYFADIYGRLHERFGSQAKNFDYRNQPYIFDYARFAERNPAALRDSPAA